MDAIMRKEIARQLVAGLGGSSDWKLALVIGIVASVAGICAGIVIGQFIDFTPTPDPNNNPVAWFGQLQGWW
jgi:hypothetical protein